LSLLSPKRFNTYLIILHSEGNLPLSPVILRLA
jgi:hypothetical protein